jgi:hypothetical protein
MDWVDGKRLASQSHGMKWSHVWANRKLPNGSDLLIHFHPSPVPIKPSTRTAFLISALMMEVVFPSEMSAAQPSFT